MASQIFNIVRFTGLDNGVPTALPHGLNLDGIKLTPDQCLPSAGGFFVSVDDTNVTVTREPGAADSVDILVSYETSSDRVFGPSNPQPNADGTPSGLGHLDPNPFSPDLSALNPGAPLTCLVYSNTQPTKGNVYGINDWELCLEVANSITRDPSKGRAMICFDVLAPNIPGGTFTVPAPASPGDVYDVELLEFFVPIGTVLFAPGQKWNSFPNFRANRIGSWFFDGSLGPIADTADPDWIGGLASICILNVGAHRFRNDGLGAGSGGAFRTTQGKFISFLSRAARFDLGNPGNQTEHLVELDGTGNYAFNADGRVRTEAQGGALVVAENVMKSIDAGEIAGVWDIMFMGAVQRAANFQPENQPSYGGAIKYPGNAGTGGTAAQRQAGFFYNPRNTPNPLVGGVITADTTLEHGDHARVAPGGETSITLTLPDPRGHAGETITVFNFADPMTGSAVTVVPSGGATINNDPGTVAPGTSQQYRVGSGNNIGLTTIVPSAKEWDAL
jgi:hypothetical protein